MSKFEPKRLEGNEAEGPAMEETALPTDTTGFWQTVLLSVPWGLALLEAQTSQTLWINTALKTMLAEGIGHAGVIGETPLHFLPNLCRSEWDAAREALLQPDENQNAAPYRLQFVYEATRHIAYWDWNLQATPDSRYQLLTVQSVSDTVLNERTLATLGRQEARARQRAEALVRLNQLVSESHTIPDLLRAIVLEAANYFESEHAAVLLREDESLRIGYSIGLAGEDANADFLHNPAETLTRQAIEKGETLVLAAPPTDLRTPLLDNNAHPAAMISNPIRQGNRMYGVVEVYFAEPRLIPDEARALLGTFADQVGLALQKADLNQKIAEQRHQLQSIFDNAPVSIIRFDTDFRAVAINQFAAHKYGGTVEEMLGQRYDTIFDNIPVELFESVLQGKPFHASHFVYHYRDGSDGVCDVSIQPLRDEEDHVVGLLMLSFEVTELVQARQEAETARQAAENALAEVRSTQTQMVQMEKMRAIGELASGVAHDLNNALMAILGYAELAEDSLDDRATLESSLKIIHKATMDATSTVRRVQNFARQRPTSHGEPVDVNQIVQDVVEMTRPRWRDDAQRQGRRYHVETRTEPLPLLIAEASGLREVLINMIHNALDAMPDGGTLTLATRTRESREIEIEVADTGKGMTPEIATRIFDPFFTTRGVEGTGLGLAVSWTIIQRHGGNIVVDSVPERGTRFLIHLPVQEDVRSSAPTARLEPPPTGRRILVVDDEPFVASVLTSILTRHGHRVTTVSNAQDALQHLREPGMNYQLVLTDHGMPGMTGLELIAELKRNGPQLPVVLLTGWGQSLLQNNVTEFVPDEVLGKPINQADLLDTITRVLREAEKSPGGKPKTGSEA